MTWGQFELKYKGAPCRDEMTEEQEREYVEDLFVAYEQENNFSKVFWSQGGDYPQYIGKPFTLAGRVPVYENASKKGVDLECLPMWYIRFEDGFQMEAYPDEIVLSVMKDNGYPEECLVPAAANK